MLSFTPGLAQVDPDILKAGMQPMICPRSPQFAELFYACADGLKAIFQTQHDVALLTATGTAAMEAAVINFLTPNDKVLVINAGGFSTRWLHIAKTYNIPCDEFMVPYGQSMDLENLATQLKSKSYQAVLLVAHESSVGALFDVQSVGALVKQAKALFMVNAISSLCADPFFMDDWSVDVALLSSHKALALPPGLAFVAFNDKAKQRLSSARIPACYLNLQHYLDFQEKGQTPFASAVNLLQMLHQRLQQINHMGIEKEIERHQQRANFFRRELSKTAFKLFPESMSNALTAIECAPSINAKVLVNNLAVRDIFLGLAAPEVSDRVFRVSHMGYQKDNEVIELLGMLNQIAT